ncbi:MAG TPA: integrase arm-type DNA-binding domain-containing protein [Rhodanobacter sp.]|jgi:integrase|nr:integrase arm-type DNA-binding domain-containing protein [Rhodanobacter sp.]
MLTDTKLRALKPRPSVYRIADAGGLCIEVRPTGAKLWRYRYRYTGKARMLALGEYPSVSLLDARNKRNEARAVLKAGIDPSVNAKAKRVALSERAANTFAALAIEWLEQNAHTVTTGTQRRDRRVFERHLNPWIGDVAIADVPPPMLLAALRRIESSGAVETAHRARGLASRLFRYAIATGRAERNPATELIGALKSPVPKHFASITDPQQVAVLLRAIDGYSGTPTVAAALKLAPLVFVRPGELRTARWADIDLEMGEWRFVATKTQTPHIVPLASQVVAILRELQPLTGRGEFLFPGIRSQRRPMSENTITAALRALGYDGDAMTGHGFRAMARTILDEVLHIRPDYIEHQLAHAVRDPNGRAYNRTAHLPERRKMMQQWADYLDMLKQGGNVVPIRKAAR